MYKCFFGINLQFDFRSKKYLPIRTFSIPLFLKNNFHCTFTYDDIYYITWDNFHTAVSKKESSLIFFSLNYEDNYMENKDFEIVM